jgi:hypothetical protein
MNDHGNSSHASYAPTLERFFGDKLTNFDYGQYGLASGDSISGCVVFQLPTSVSSSKVEFNAENGDGGE